MRLLPNIGEQYIVTKKYHFFNDWGVKVGDIFTLIYHPTNNVRCEFHKILHLFGGEQTSTSLGISEDTLDEYCRLYNPNETIVEYVKRIKRK